MSLTLAKAANCVLLLWGCLFCLVAALAFWNAKNYNAGKRRWMIVMQLTTAVMMLSDAGSLVFDGVPSRVGWWMVRISNCVLFCLTDITMLAFTQYLCACLLTPEETRTFKRVRTARTAGWIGVGLVLLTQVTGLYYSFDAANVYHRGAGYWISLVIPVACMLADSSLLFQYRQRISRRQLAAMGSYIMLPLVGCVIQAVHYGWSLISLTVGISMILMFLVSTGEQNEELRQLETSRAQIAEKLEIATMLNRCVEKLSDGTDMDNALNSLMEAVRDYFKADRSYLFEIISDQNTMVNTYEAVDAGVTPQIDNLQELPVDCIAHWMAAFQKEQVYYMDSLEQEKGYPSYEVLHPQNIWRLLAMPLCRGGQVIGFLGLDNPREHEQDATLLASIQFFVTNTLDRRDQQRYLKRMGYYDMLTRLKNRNSYIERLNEWKQIGLEQVGGVYVDLNGLKKTNDTLGHEAGDALICRTASVLEAVFPGQAYRIGGDEFVVLMQGIPQETFEEKVKQFRAELQRQNVDAAVGMVWEPHTRDAEVLLRRADERMYEEKQKMKAL